MKPETKFNHTYLELATALAKFQESDADNPTQLTIEILGFFQSEFAEELQDTTTTTPALNIKPEPVKPLLKNFIATIYFFDGDEGMATVEEKVEAKNLRAAEDLINAGLTLGGWATVQPA